MSILEGLVFVKKPPKVASLSGQSPVERGRKKFVGDIDTQIALAGNPEFEIVKPVNKRDGTTGETRRKPRSWVHVSNGEAYITVRFSNKPIPLGGKRGGIIRCSPSDVEETLATVRRWALSEEATGIIEKMLLSAKRGKRNSEK